MTLRSSLEKCPLQKQLMYEKMLAFVNNIIKNYTDDNNFWLFDETEGLE
jgi:hypothetical protein